MKYFFLNFSRVMYVIPLVLVFMFTCVISVSASTISVDVSGNIDNMAFNPGQTNMDTSGIKLSITTSDITSGWTVKVSDLSNSGKSPSYSGRLVEWDGSQYVTSGPKVLGTNVTVMGYAGNNMINSTATLGPIGSTIESGSTSNTWSNIPIVIKQYVDYNDMYLATGHVYKTLITFEGTAT